MHSNPLVLRLGLVLVSIVVYAVLARSTEKLETIEGIPETGLWFHYVVGGVFGALVLAPFIGPRHRVVRFAGALHRERRDLLPRSPIRDRRADRLRHDHVLHAGRQCSRASSGLAVVVIAPRAFTWKLLPLALVAGALGGAAFDLNSRSIRTCSSDTPCGSCWSALR